MSSRSRESDGALGLGGGSHRLGLGGGGVEAEGEGEGVVPAVDAAGAGARVGPGGGGGSGGEGEEVLEEVVLGAPGRRRLPRHGRRRGCGDGRRRGPRVRGRSFERLTTRETATASGLSAGEVCEAVGEEEAEAAAGRFFSRGREEAEGLWAVGFLCGPMG